MKEEKAIKLEVEIPAPVADVWNAWTTEEGVKTFFAPEAKINIDIYGEYELYFIPREENGHRGSEDCKVLACEPEKMLSITWNAPPQLPEVRFQKTVVILRFEKINDKRTRVNLTHIGWGEGHQWNDAFEYFEHAWGKIVLPRLKYSFEHGPVNWDNPPEV